jgi:PiT family inorganic phosphate transporter
MDHWTVVLVVLLAMGFTYTNGFHDAATAIATSVTTRALTPRIALTLAAVMNLLGAFAGVPVARTIGGNIIAVPSGSAGLALCVGALVGAIVWNLLTWYRGLPTSSTHALIGGLCGAALAAGATIDWMVIRDSVLIPMVLSPLVGLLVGYLLMVLIVWLFRRAAPGPAARGFRYAQTVSAAAVAFGHGMQDAAKSAGVVALALVASGAAAPATADDERAGVPWWVFGLLAVMLAAGTYAGGWRIVRTLGRRIIHLEPPQGFAAEAAAAGVLGVATASGAPISTTHVIAASITGAGAVPARKRIRWGVAREIALMWVLTFPGAGLAAAVVYAALSPFT